MSYQKSWSSKITSQYIITVLNQYGYTNTYPSSKLTSDNSFSGTYGDAVPQWKQRIREADQAGTAMSIVDTKFKVGKLAVGGRRRETNGTHFTERQLNGTFHINYESGFINPSNSSEAKANNDALGTLIGKLDNEITHFQGGVFLGELREATQLLVNPLGAFRRRLGTYVNSARSRARRASSATRSGRRQSSRELNRSRNHAIAETWLEHSFGWSPLINDIDDASEYLANYTTNRIRPDVKVVSAIGSDTKSAINQQSFTSSNPYYNIMMKHKVKHETKVRYKACLRLDHYGTHVHQDLGLGLRNFAPTVWELIPYSFLVDYFSNVGKIVTAASFPRGRVAWVMKWVIVERTLTKEPFSGDLTSSPPQTHYGNWFVGSPASKRIRTITRSAYTGSLIPGFQVKVPGLLRQWANIAALTRVKF